MFRVRNEKDVRKGKLLFEDRESLGSEFKQPPKAEEGQELDPPWKSPEEAGSIATLSLSS